MAITDVFSRDLFAGKHVFVTGGGSGINLGIAKNFAAVGAKIGMCGRSQERLDGAAAELRELGGDVFAQSADVRDYAALESAMAAPATRSARSPRSSAERRVTFRHPPRPFRPTVSNP